MTHKRAIGAPAQQSAAERYARAEAALAESERRFRGLLQNAPIGLFHALPEGRFLIVNPATEAFFRQRATEPNQGSCFSFTLTLPSHDRVTPLAARNDLPVAGLAPGQPPCRVLIVDGQSRLGAAVDLGDFGRITALLEQIQERDPRLAATLETWAYNDDLDAFVQVLTGRQVRTIESHP